MKYKDCFPNKKILFVLCNLELGGAERQALHLIKYLHEKCHTDIRVWSTEGKGLVNKELEDMGIACKIVPFRWPCRKVTLMKNIPNFIRHLRKEKPDIIMAYTTVPNIACGFLWRFSSARLCVWNQRNDANMDLTGHKLEHLAMYLTPLVICNAKHIPSLLVAKIRADKKKIHVVYNGVDLKKPIHTTDWWRKKIGAENKTFIACMVANFRPQKDHETLLKAWKIVMDKLKDNNISAILVLAGAPQFTFESVQSLINQLTINDSVKVLGQVEDITGLLQSVNLGLLSSHYEGLPNAVLEYMAVGLPVIGTDLPGIREALGPDSDSLLTPRKDAQKLAAIIVRLALDTNLRKKIGNNNKKRIAKFFSVQKMIRNSLKIIALHSDGH
jgi:glycosyltransferase involved in cell wall biosynthesis